jgi:hypothetical protein
MGANALDLVVIILVGDLALLISADRGGLGIVALGLRGTRCLSRRRDRMDILQALRCPSRRLRDPMDILQALHPRSLRLRDPTDFLQALRPRSLRLRDPMDILQALRHHPRLILIW